MRLTLFRKLFISLLLISTIMMLGMALLINNSFKLDYRTILTNGKQKKCRLLLNRSANITRMKMAGRGFRNSHIYGQIF
jgi:two-component system sensor histidine kinase BaeS